MKLKYILIFGIVLLTIGIASALLEGRIFPNILPDGNPIPTPIDETSDNNYIITNLTNSLNDTELNTLYYKVIVPEDTGDQWNLSVEFAESKPYLQIIPSRASPVNGIYIVARKQLSYAWVCCNITKGDRLYTTDTNVTNGSALRGTLTNLYDINYKTRDRESGSWTNIFVGASQNPKVYNRRGALHIDGTQIAWAMETRNVTNVSIPELINVFLI